MSRGRTRPREAGRGELEARSVRVAEVPRTEELGASPQPGASAGCARSEQRFAACGSYGSGQHFRSVTAGHHRGDPNIDTARALIRQGRTKEALSALDRGKGKSLASKRRCCALRRCSARGIARERPLWRIVLGGASEQSLCVENSRAAVETHPAAPRRRIRIPAISNVATSAIVRSTSPCRPRRHDNHNLPLRPSSEPELP